MDRKGIILLIISVLLLLAWVPLMSYYSGSTGQRTSESDQTNRVSRQPADTNQTAPQPSQRSATELLGPSAPQLAESADQEKVIDLENSQARYQFSTLGGGLKAVELKGYAKSVSCDGENGESTTNLVSLNSNAPVPAMSLLGLEPEDSQDSAKPYRVKRLSSDRVQAEKQLTNGLTIVKEFQIRSNYLVAASIRLENRSESKISVPAQTLVIGTASPIDGQGDPSLLGLYWYNGEEAEHIGQSWFENRTLGCFRGQPRSEYTAGNNNVGWAAVHNQFFALAVMPQEPAYRIAAWPVPLSDGAVTNNASRSGAGGPRIGYQTALVYPSIDLAPQQSVERQYDIYAGPKEYNKLARIGAEFENDLDLLMEFDGFFGFFAKILLLSMNGIHNFGITYGWSIVVITVIIKILFWPLTRASTRSMKRMSALQPQMKEIQEKYKDDPKKMQSKLMEFMKEHKVSPLGGCLPMLLQIPVFLGFFTMLRTAIELRGASFLWACDLSQSDTVAHLPGLGFPINPMPLLMAVTMLWQTRLQPPSPGMDPTQQKIMKYMPLMIVVFLYQFSAGLTLYWTVQNLLTIAQMKLTKNIDEPGKGGTPAGTAVAGPKQPAKTATAPIPRSGKKKKKKK